MHVAVYTRVSTMRQAQAQTTDQQLDRLRAYAEQQGWNLTADLVFRDDGYSGASLRRPGLDRRRDAAASARLDRILITELAWQPMLRRSVNVCAKVWLAPLSTVSAGCSNCW